MTRVVAPRKSILVPGRVVGTRKRRVRVVWDGGPLLVTETWGRAASAYPFSITHAPTGCLLTVHKTEDEARGAVQRILPLANWKAFRAEQGTPDLARRVRAAAAPGRFASDVEREWEEADR